VGLPVPCATDLAIQSVESDKGLHETLVITSSRHAVSIDTLTSAPLSGRLLSTVI
jgi:hypothetical protein